jgi:nucleotide-binding universal stress UspA family protein
MDTTTTAPAGSIVVGIDGSDSARRALTWAVAQATAERRPLTLVHAIPPAGAAWLDQAGIDHRIGVEAVQQAGSELLEQARQQVAAHEPDLEVRQVLAVADPRALLLDLSGEAAAVVLGSRGRGPIRSLLLGSVGVAVSRHARCPVVIHRTSHPGEVRDGVLVGVDGSSPSQAALELGFAHASLHRLPLTALHAFYDAPAAVSGPHRVAAGSPDVEEHRLLLAEALAGLREKYPDVHVRTELARGPAAACLAEMSKRMHLVVVGAHDGGLASEVVFGNIATAVVEHSLCPVVVVPAPRS